MLYKIPLILINAFTFDRSNTPPHQTNTSQQKRTGVDPNSFLGLFERAIVRVAACARVNLLISGACGVAHSLAQIGYSLLSACEIATIIASQTPTHENSRHILTFFNVSSLGSVGNITPTFLIGSVFLITGANIRFRCFKVMGERFTFAMSLRDSHKLCTSGPYSIVRHPSYTGGCIKMAGGLMTVMCSGSWWYSGGYSTPIGIALGLDFVLSGAICVYAFMRGGEGGWVLEERVWKAMGWLGKGCSIPVHTWYCLTRML